MPEFFNVFAPDVALRTLLERLQRRVKTEIVPTHQALGRVTAEAVLAVEYLPAFPRSTMDGYAVRARDTFGASESLPAYLQVIGEVQMGQAPDITLATGQAAVAYTGGMLAHSADAVVMVENTQKIDTTSIEVLRPVAPGENVIQVGEDVRLGEVIVPAGGLLRPQDIGGLLALGITQVKVCCRPRVAMCQRATKSSHPTPRQLLGRSVTSTRTPSQPWWNRRAACLSLWEWSRTTMKRSARWLSRGYHRLICSSSPPGVR